MLVLAVETSSPRGSLALAEVNHSVKILAESDWLRGKSHSELVTTTAAEILQSSGKSVDDLDGVAVGVGPGSFTGVRVGINFAKALGYSLDCPIWQIDSLKVWARPLWHLHFPILVAVHGFRDLIYTMLISDPAKGRSVVRPPEALTLDQVIKTFPKEDVTIAGDAWEHFSDLWPAEIKARVKGASKESPNAKFLFSDLVESSSQLEGTSWQNVKPLYIRGSEAEEKLRQGLLKPLPKL